MERHAAQAPALRERHHNFSHFFSTGYPAFFHAYQPPLSAKTFACPFLIKYRAARALVLSFFQVQ